MQSQRARTVDQQSAGQGLLGRLPIELLREVVFHLSFHSLCQLSATNSSFYSIIQNDDTIFREIAWRLPERTAALSHGVFPSPAPFRRSLLAMVNHGSMRRYPSITTFKKFARHRCLTDRNWDERKCSSRVVKMGKDVQDVRFQGFALDVQSARIITQSFDEDGPPMVIGYSVYSADGNELESNRRMSTDFLENPLEVSEGYLSFVMLENTEIWIFRQASITSPPSPLSPSQLAKMTRSGRHVLYQPYAFLDTGSSFNCTKLRFPYFCAASSEDRVVAIWNLADMGLDSGPMALFSIKSLWYADDRGPGLNYIDFDKEFVYVAHDRRFSAWSIATGRMSRPSIATFGRRDFTAVNYDASGDSLISICEGCLSWRPGYKCGESESDVRSKTVHLVIDEAHIAHLAVGNGRAVFTTVSNDPLDLHVWLLNLQDFDDLESFKAHPPRPTCLTTDFKGIEEIAGIVMTADEIYVPVFQSKIVNFVDQSTSLADCLSLDEFEMPWYEMGWYDSSDQCLVSLMKFASPDGYERSHSKDIIRCTPPDDCNGMLVLSFAP